ncbi:hypothetical protein OG241_06870 [Streptomyces sp. NBC_01390]|uniref:hypothetical protein n=1 Tax=Streptomyces sp. NBC_01390 TaxID=2903850 RepID=UPI003247DD0D
MVLHELGRARRLRLGLQTAPATSNAAAAILTDALGFGGPVGCGIRFTSEPEGMNVRRLREDFCRDVLSPLCDEWRLRCGVVLRWSLAWYPQSGITELPGALQEMPAF